MGEVQSASGLQIPQLVRESIRNAQFPVLRFFQKSQQQHRGSSTRLLAGADSAVALKGVRISRDQSSPHLPDATVSPRKALRQSRLAV